MDPFKPWPGNPSSSSPHLLFLYLLSDCSLLATRQLAHPVATQTAELVLYTFPLLSLSSYCNPPRSTCHFAEEARLSSASSSYCMGPFIPPERLWLIVSSYRGDGACGKTSLLNVFTRGYVESIARMWFCRNTDAPGNRTGTSRQYSKPPVQATTRNFHD